MAPKCKDFCTDKHNFPYKTMKKFKFEDGWKRCYCCTISILSSDIKCICCGTTYRTRPRSSKYRKQLLVNVPRY